MHKRFSRQTFDSDLVFKALKDEAFRKKLVSDPTATYAAELAAAIPGQTIPDGVEVRVATEMDNIFYVVLPCVPDGTHLTQETLHKVASHEVTHRNPCWGLGDAPE
ncbi:MAG: NHLP leader peptide family RiPP precursor [Pseudomonadota bacterium]